MKTVAIVGVGLIGASFGLAIRRAGFDGQIIGVSSQPAIDAALSAGAITAEASLEDACRAADLVYLSQTVDNILTTIPFIAKYVGTNSVITDAGSTKGTIVRQAEQYLSHVCFVGGHPLAGKEARGAAAASADLFENRPYILTHVQGRLSPYLAIFRQLLSSIGARVIELSPAEHDLALAFTSHLPQLVSTTLAATLEQQDNPDLSRLFGPGLIDMTRLALSPAEIWRPILAENQQQVLRALDAFLLKLSEARDAVQSGNIDLLFNAAQQFAATIRKRES